MNRFMRNAIFIGDPDNCWEWGGSRHPQGYGHFWDGTKVRRAHRWIYETLIGSIQHGLVLDHLCRNPGCVNPSHLEAVAQRTNVLRGTAPPAIQARQTSCIHGHELNGDNLYIKPNGARQCKTCRRAADRRRKVPYGN